MLIRLTTIIEIAGVSVSPAPRRHALATSITVRNGRQIVSIRRYDSANPYASGESPVKRIQRFAQKYKTAASTNPRTSDADTLCPQTPFPSRRWREPLARAISAVDPVPTALTIRPMNQRRYEIVPTAAV